MRKKSNVIFGILILFLFIGVTFVIAHGEETFAQAEEIIKQKISCDDLTDYQLEILGDYYMEQMHPGELHEIMDERMGGEGSESLRQVHINIGLSFYCAEHESFGTGMMNMMMGRGMMYGYDNEPEFLLINWIFNILIISVLVLLIILLVNKLQGGKKHGEK